MGFTSHTTLFPVLLLCLALYCTPAAAFGAGNIASISKIEGVSLSLLPSILGADSIQVKTGAMVISKTLSCSCSWRLARPVVDDASLTPWTSSGFTSETGYAITLRPSIPVRSSTLRRRPCGFL